MGITGLLPLLSKASTPIKLDEIKNKTTAVDAYVWIHKGITCCADKLARGEDTDEYVKYVMKYVTMLRSFKIKPIMVFDGRHLHSKAITENKRREERNSAKSKAAELLRLDRKADALQYLRKSIDVTHHMALKVIKACRLINVDCVVAPYEADAQLAYLNIQNIADYVITEDSDLIVFGAPRIITKLDLAGNGLLVEKDKICQALGIRENNYSEEKFRHMCIISGCDYLKSLPNIGLAKAKKFIFSNINTDMTKAISRMPFHLNMPKLKVPPTYCKLFEQADYMFKHQLVFDPITRKTIHLREDIMEDNVESKLNITDFDNKLDEKLAYQLALGNIDPFSLEQVDDWDPDEVCKTNEKFNTSSIWSKNFNPKANDETLQVKISNSALGSIKRSKELQESAKEGNRVNLKDDKKNINESENIVKDSIQQQSDVGEVLKKYTQAETKMNVTTSPKDGEIKSFIQNRLQKFSMNIKKQSFLGDEQIDDILKETSPVKMLSINDPQHQCEDNVLETKSVNPFLKRKSTSIVENEEKKAKTMDLKGGLTKLMSTYKSLCSLESSMFAKVGSQKVSQDFNSGFSDRQTTKGSSDSENISQYFKKSPSPELDINVDENKIIEQTVESNVDNNILNKNEPDFQNGSQNSDSGISDHQNSPDSEYYKRSPSPDYDLKCNEVEARKILREMNDINLKNIESKRKIFNQKLENVKRTVSSKMFPFPTSSSSKICASPETELSKSKNIDSEDSNKKKSLERKSSNQKKLTDFFMVSQG